MRQICQALLGIAYIRITLIYSFTTTGIGFKNVINTNNSRTINDLKPLLGLFYGESLHKTFGILCQESIYRFVKA